MMDTIYQLLIIDDSPEDQIIYKHYIAKTFQQTCHIKSMEKGYLALDFLKTQQVDCILLDYHLPDMTGIDFLIKLKQTGGTTPVIMLTGIGNEKIAIEALKNGAYDYLNKSELKPEILFNTIANAMEKSLLTRKIKAKELEINFLAYHDFLTQIPNRAQFELQIKKEFAQSKRCGHSFAIFFIDLDRFKFINDNYGHETGDKLLKVVARIFQQCIRSDDVLARIGGDEFAILIPKIKSADNVAAIAHKLISALALPLVINHHKIKISPSIGIAIYPNSATTIPKLLSHADLALYKAKKNRNSFCYFTEELTTESAQQIQIESAIYEALETHNLYLCYQPIINMQTNHLFGMELLLRSNHPDLKPISIQQIIDIANKTDLITPLGAWILDKGFKQLSIWRKKKVPRFKLCINLSIKQLMHKNWFSTLHELMRKYQIDAHEIIFELAESDIVFSLESIKEQVSALTALGYELLLDNFGAGVSSLNLLRELPLTGVKLDKSFITQIEPNSQDMRMIHALHLLISSLEMSLIITGIETEQQFNLLKSYPSLLGQGFHLHKPIRNPLTLLSELL